MDVRAIRSPTVPKVSTPLLTTPTLTRKEEERGASEIKTLFSMTTTS
jgi:hypothetical protein